MGRKRDSAETVAMTICARRRRPAKTSAVVEKTVTFEENIHFEDFRS